jgi:hypothetical protein
MSILVGVPDVGERFTATDGGSNRPPVQLIGEFHDGPEALSSLSGVGGVERNA